MIFFFKSLLNILVYVLIKEVGNLKTILRKSAKIGKSINAVH